MTESNDLISRIDAINAIKELSGNCDSRFYDEALTDAQSEILALPDLNKFKWISIEDKKPEPSSFYLVADEDNIILEAYYNAAEKWLVYGGVINDRIKYWMSLPAAPNDKNSSEVEYE